jgi:NAD(P)-dependent dehydrogenase (short-subunit alcohol dehydrogenase family)
VFEGKVALITGASSGIGLSLTKKLLRRGCKVAMVARTASTLHALEKELGPNAAAFPADVCDFEALTALPGRVNDRLGRLDFLVNNAGVNHRGSIAKHSPAKLAEVVTTNLTAAIVLTRAAYPVLR